MTKPSVARQPSRRIPSAALFIALAVVQILCAAFFVGNLIATIFGLRSEPLSWTWVEILEIMATAGLILGMILGAAYIRGLLRQRREAQERLRAASGAFQEAVHDRFSEWGLSPSERDVALFMIKGFSNTEIADLRGTTEGTIKAQSTAVFRKAGVNGRAQLLGAFIDDLLAPPTGHSASDVPPATPLRNE
jgi:DNA-binding CsgD family transcriptional regulator